MRNENRDKGIATNVESTPGTPRWVKVFGIIVLIVILLFLILMFTRGPGGRHGPGRHMRSSDVGQTFAASGLEEHQLSRDARS